MMSETFLSNKPPLEAHTVTDVNEALPKDGQEVVVYQRDSKINLPLELSGARIEHNMIKADRAVRVGEALASDKRAAIIAAEDARLAEVRAAFNSVTSEPTPIATPVLAQ